MSFHFPLYIIKFYKILLHFPFITSLYLSLFIAFYIFSFSLHFITTEGRMKGKGRGEEDRMKGKGEGVRSVATH